MYAVFPPVSLEENEIHVVKTRHEVPRREQDIEAAAVSRQGRDPDLRSNVDAALSPFHQDHRPFGYHKTPGVRRGGHSHPAGPGKSPPRGLVAMVAFVTVTWTWNYESPCYLIVIPA
jgi:hypothetical protein